MKSLWIATLSVFVLICLTMMAELDSLNHKLEHLTVQQEHRVRYAQRQLEQAKLYEAQGDLTLAKQAFERLVDPSVPMVAQQAVVALNRLRVKQSINALDTLTLKDLKHLKQVIQATPQLSKVWLKSLQFIRALKEGLTSEAITLGAALLEDPAVHDGIVFQYARLLRENQRPKDAYAVLEDFLTEHPNSSGAWASLGQLQQDEKHFGKAIKSYKAALKIDPKPRYLLSIARLHMYQSNWDKASTLIQPEALPSPLRHEALKLKAACHFQMKSYETSATLYQQAYALNPDPNTLLSKVIALQVAGKYESALESIQMIIKQERELPHIHFHRAQILIATGLTAEAAKSFVQFLKLAEGMPKHAKRIKHAANWMKQYQRSLIVPPAFQNNGGVPSPQQLQAP